MHPFTKLTDQQHHAGALLILMHAAIQVVYINIFCGMLNLTPMVEARRLLIRIE